LRQQSRCHHHKPEWRIAKGLEFIRLSSQPASQQRSVRTRSRAKLEQYSYEFGAGFGRKAGIG
jgi:hypothetical protein